MANIVIKKDGSKVPFDAQKLKASITAAAADAGLSEDQKEVITQKVSSAVIAALGSTPEVSSAEIKSMVLSELGASAEQVAQAWLEYEKTEEK